MTEPSARAQLRALFAALRDGETDRLEEVVDADAWLEVPGQNRLAGTHRGSQGVAAWLRSRREGLDEFDAFGDDVALSGNHAVLLYAVRARRGQDRLTSHEALVAHHESGSLAEMFLYLFEQAGFDRFYT